MNIDGLKNIIISIWLSAISFLPIHQQAILNHQQSMPTPTPIIEVKPSEKALKVAAYGWVHMTDVNKSQIKKSNGDTNADDNTAIKEWALRMDKDLVLMARDEAVMEKSKEDVDKLVISQTPQSQQTKVSHYPLNDAELQERIQLFKNKGFSEKFINDHMDEIRWGKNIPIYTQDPNSNSQLEDLRNEFEQYKSGQDYNCITSGGVPSDGMCLGKH